MTTKAGFITGIHSKRPNSCRRKFPYFHCCFENNVYLCSRNVWLFPAEHTGTLRRTRQQLAGNAGGCFGGPVLTSLPSDRSCGQRLWPLHVVRPVMSCCPPQRDWYAVGRRLFFARQFGYFRILLYLCSRNWRFNGFSTSFAG